MNKITFGVAGFPPNFLISKYKKDKFNIFDWLNEIELDSIELQCTYGFKTSDSDLARFKQLSQEKGIALTVHAPYYINLASQNEIVQMKSIENMKQGVLYCQKCGAKKLIFHPGGGWGKTDEERKCGVQKIIELLNNISKDIDMQDVRFYPEIGGKINSLGSLDEIILICKNVKYAYPCIDIAHLHAREVGSMTSKDKILQVLNKIENELGRDSLEKTHFHVYAIDYTNMGEKVHKTYSLLDENGNHYFPLPQDFIFAIKEKNIFPSIICEAKDAQDIDAKILKDIYNKKM